MTLLSDIGTYLDDNSIGTVATDLFLGYMPDSPDVLVAVFTSSGGPPMYTMSKTKAMSKPGLQVFTRGEATGAGFVAAEAKAHAVHALLDLVNTTLGTTLYIEIAPVDEPVLMERDESERPVFVANYEVSYA